MKASPLAAGLLALVLCAGCGPSATLPPAPRAAEAAPFVEPRFDVASPLRLERLGRRLQIGADEATLRAVFPKPDGAYVFNDLPTKLRGVFESRGWENGTEGFGAILYGGRVALAMRQFYAIDGARFDELFDTVRSANRSVRGASASGRNADFWFWIAESQTLMVLRRGVKGNRYDMTIALGDKSLMDSLDMSPAKVAGIVERLKAESSKGASDAKGPAPRDRGEGAKAGG